MIYEFQAQLFDTEAEMLLHIAHAYVCGGDDWDNEVSSEYLNDMTDREIAEEIFNDWYKEDADGGFDLMGDPHEPWTIEKTDGWKESLESGVSAFRAEALADKV